MVEWLKEMLIRREVVTDAAPSGPHCTDRDVPPPARSFWLSHPVERDRRSAREASGGWHDYGRLLTPTCPFPQKQAWVTIQ